MPLNVVFRQNPAFAAMLGYSADQRFQLVGRTFFSLVAPQDMQYTLKVVAQLLAGELSHIPLTQNCLRQDGTSATFCMEMNCLWKNNKVCCIVCFMKPADEAAAGGARDAQGGAHAIAQHGLAGFSAAGGLGAYAAQPALAGALNGLNPGAVGFLGAMGSQWGGFTAPQEEATSVGLNGGSGGVKNG
jgi:hypothetical protein